MGFLRVVHLCGLLFFFTQCSARPNLSLDSLEQSAIFDKLSALGQYNVSQFAELVSRVSERLTPELINDAFGIHIGKGEKRYTYVQYEYTTWNRCHQSVTKFVVIDISTMANEVDLTSGDSLN